MVVKSLVLLWLMVGGATGVSSGQSTISFCVTDKASSNIYYLTDLTAPMPGQSVAGACVCLCVPRRVCAYAHDGQISGFACVHMHTTDRTSCTTSNSESMLTVTPVRVCPFCLFFYRGPV